MQQIISFLILSNLEASVGAQVFMKCPKGPTLFCLASPFHSGIPKAPFSPSSRIRRLVSSCLLTIIQGKRLFIKDITHYLVPPDRKPASIAPSLSGLMHGAGSGELIANGLSDGSTTAPYPYHTVAEPGNPTVVPHAILKKFHFTFLIRHPRLSIPSYYRCTVPPLDKMTGFYDFMPSEAGYGELRRVFDYLHSNNLIGPKIAGLGAVGTENKSNSITNSDSGHVEICVIDADDLLDNPSGIIEAYCKSVAIDYDPEMLRWDTPEDHQQALDTFEKWKGFHEDAINSTQLRARLHVSSPITSLPTPLWLVLGRNVTNLSG